jgi:hypothetical protein
MEPRNDFADGFAAFQRTLGQRDQQGDFEDRSDREISSANFSIGRTKMQTYSSEDHKIMGLAGSLFFG